MLILHIAAGVWLAGVLLILTVIAVQAVADRIKP